MTDIGEYGILANIITISSVVKGCDNMPKFFCSTQKKEVVIDMDLRDASALDDYPLETIPGRKVCMENALGRCFEFAQCPLNNER